MRLVLNVRPAPDDEMRLVLNVRPALNVMNQSFIPDLRA